MSGLGKDNVNGAERAGFVWIQRPTGSNPFHQSRGPLAAILPLFPRRLQLPVKPVIQNHQVSMQR
jgi:hypothetical protein